MSKRKTLKDIVFDIYRELYKKSTPSADFDELVENAEIGDDGRKIIPYMDYYIDDDEYKSIVDKYISRYKRRGKNFTDSIKFNAYLGCGPTSSKKNEKESGQT
jgi:hypothetical protein